MRSTEWLPASHASGFLASLGAGAAPRAAIGDLGH